MNFEDYKGKKKRVIKAKLMSKKDEEEPIKSNVSDEIVNVEPIEKIGLTEKELNDIIARAIESAIKSINDENSVTPVQDESKDTSEEKRPLKAKVIKRKKRHIVKSRLASTGKQEPKSKEVPVEDATKDEKKSRAIGVKDKVDKEYEDATKRIEDAKKALKDAKSMQGDSKKKTKKTKDAIKKAKKELRKAKLNGIKAGIKKKKIEKAIETLYPTSSNVKEPKKSLLTKLKDSWKRVVASITIATVITGGAYALKNTIKSNNSNSSNPQITSEDVIDETNIEEPIIDGENIEVIDTIDKEEELEQEEELEVTDNQVITDTTNVITNNTIDNTPTIKEEQVSVEEPVTNTTTTSTTPSVSETITTSDGLEETLDVVKDNIDNLDIEEGYTTSDANELIKFLNGEDSTLSADEANSMLEDIVSSVVSPAINNSLIGEEVYETQKLNIANILASDPAYGAIQDMEDYINGSIENPDNLTDYAKFSLEDQALIINNSETVDGFNITTASPGARLLWANLAAGMNGLSGTLGEDVTISVNGTTYAQSEINNGTILQMVVNGAKQDLGSESKTITIG